MQQLSAFIDSALSGVSRELVTRHLAACGACRDKHAAWKAADESLRQALAWTPNERTLEGWSSRVEMCITAERKGLPVPEFTPTLLPVIAPVTPTSLPRMRELLESARGTMFSHARGPAAAKPAEPSAAGTPSEAPRPAGQAPEPVRASAPSEQSEPAPEPAHDAMPDPPVAAAEAEAATETEIIAEAENPTAQAPELDAETAAIAADDSASPGEAAPLFGEDTQAEPELEAAGVAEPDIEDRPELVTEPEEETEPELEPRLQLEPVFVAEPEAPDEDEPEIVAGPRLQIESVFVPEPETPTVPVSFAGPRLQIEPVFVPEPEAPTEAVRVSDVYAEQQTELAFVPEPDAPAEPDPVLVAEPDTRDEPEMVAEPETPAEPEPVLVAEPELQIELAFVAEQEALAEPVPEFVSEPETHVPSVSRQELPVPTPSPAREPEPVAVSESRPANRSSHATDRDPFLLLKDLKPLPEWSVPELAMPVAEGATPSREGAHESAVMDAKQARRRRDIRSLLVACSVLLIVVLTSAYMPEVIRIPLPERWRLRLPRVEFVRRGPTPAEDAASARAAALRLAARQPVVPELVPPDPSPAPVAPRTSQDSAAASSANVVTGAEATLAPAATADAAPTVAPTAASGTPERGVPATPTPARTTLASPTGSPAPVEATPALVPDSPATIIPVRITKSVRLSNPPARKPPEPEGDEQWPLLCGEVIDSEGRPVEGARVQLVSFSLTVRTDRRGRFCVACPPGVRSLRVEATGLRVVNRTVELSGEMVETRIALPPAR